MTDTLASTPAAVASAAPLALLVDDEPSVLAALRRGLRHAPFAILTASSAAAALEIVATHEVAVVVSDEQMPGTSGASFLRTLRDERPDIVRVLLTGHVSVHTTVAAINEAEVFRFLSKPCPVDELASTITAAIALHEQQRRYPRHLGDAQFAELVQHAFLVYQPIVWAYSRELYAHEALIRSHAATTPELVEAAYSPERQRALDHAVRVHVAAALPQLPAGADVFVNLFPESLADPVLTSRAEPLHGAAARVVFELTERTRLDTIGELDAQITRMRAAGFRFAIDDVGAGYAGLVSIARVQPDVVKIDMDLVRDIDSRPTQRTLVRSLLAASHEIGARSLAEGVETDAEAAVLTELGCNLLQGYLIGRPARLDDDVATEVAA